MFNFLKKKPTPLETKILKLLENEEDWEMVSTNHQRFQGSITNWIVVFFKLEHRSGLVLDTDSDPESTVYLTKNNVDFKLRGHFFRVAKEKYKNIYLENKDKKRNQVIDSILEL